MRVYIKQWGMGGIVIVAASILMGLFFELNFFSGLFLFGAICVLTFVGMRIRVGEKKRWQQYFDMIAYMELLLCSFKRLRHIKMALQDCQSAFHKDGILGQAIRCAIHILETGETKNDLPLTESALSEISRIYNCRKMEVLHHFLGYAEQTGCEITESLDILLSDLEMWKRRFVLYHKKKQLLCRECIAAALLALLLSGLSRFLVPLDFQVDFTESTIYQVSTVVVICLVTVSAMWIRYRAGLVRLDFSKKQDVTKLIQNEFPYWLSAVTIYLKQNSLYQALQYSLRETEGRFREEVECLIKAIYKKPTSLEPYLDFFADQKSPELRTGMMMLYAVSASEHSDTTKQIDSLVAQNSAVMDRCEKEYFRARIGVFCLLRQIPMILAGGKIMIDMVMFFRLLSDRFTIF